MIESPAVHQWFLRKQHDGSVFGPMPFAQLTRWASSAQVAPNDSISHDQEHWIKAPMLPELGMDWIVEVTSERLYGPTTLGSIREFLRLEEIDEQTSVINSCDATRQKIADLAPLFEAADEAEQTGEFISGPGSTGMSIAVQERIRDLEQALREERRAAAEAEQRYRELEAKYAELLAAQSE